VKNRNKNAKTAWTSGKNPLMTKGGSLPALRAGIRNAECEIWNEGQADEAFLPEGHC